MGSLSTPLTHSLARSASSRSLRQLSLAPPALASSLPPLARSVAPRRSRAILRRSGPYLARSAALRRSRPPSPEGNTPSALLGGPRRGGAAIGWGSERVRSEALSRRLAPDLAPLSRS